MILNQTYQGRHTLLVDGVKMAFLLVPDEANVSTHSFYALFESYETSLGTMATSRTPGASATQETSSLTLCLLLQRWTSPRGSTKCP